MSELTPVEKYFEEKRSGKYHPETLKNWPEQTAQEKAAEIMNDSKVLDPEQDRPLPKQPTQVTNLEKKIYTLQTWLVLVGIILFGVLIFIAVHFIDHKKAEPVKTSEIFKEAPPKPKIVYKTKVVTKVKKVIPREYRIARENLATARLRIQRLVDEQKENQSWRKRLCYEYGDWNACLAYKKNLPLRARVVRIDLLHQ